MNQVLKKIFDIIPTISFLTMYYAKGMETAIITIVMVSTVTLTLTKLFFKHISYLQIFSLVIAAFFGGLSIYSDNPNFFKFKTTLVNFFWASLLLIDLFILKKNLLKRILGAYIILSEKYWKKLALTWVCYFSFCATVNEIIWRNFSEEFWVNFKFIFMNILSFIVISGSIIILQQRAKKDAKTR